MASIISVTKFSSKPWDGNLEKVRWSVVLEDNTTAQHTFIIGPFKRDPADDGTEDANKLLSSLQRREYETIATTSSDPLVDIQNTKWSTFGNAARGIIKYMMQQKDPRIVIRLKPLLQFINQNFTDQQIANNLGITLGQVSKLKSRVAAVLSDTGTAEALLSTFDSNSEVIV